MATTAISFSISTSRKNDSIVQKICWVEQDFQYQLRLFLARTKFPNYNDMFWLVTLTKCLNCYSANFDKDFNYNWNLVSMAEISDCLHKFCWSGQIFSVPISDFTVQADIFEFQPCIFGWIACYDSNHCSKITLHMHGIKL